LVKKKKISHIAITTTWSKTNASFLILIHSTNLLLFHFENWWHLLTSSSPSSLTSCLGTYLLFFPFSIFHFSFFILVFFFLFHGCLYLLYVFFFLFELDGVQWCDDSCDWTLLFFILFLFSCIEYCIKD